MDPIEEATYWLSQAYEFEKKLTERELEIRALKAQAAELQRVIDGLVKRIVADEHMEGVS